MRRPHEVTAGVNKPRNVDVYDAALADAKRDYEQRRLQQEKYGLTVLGNTPLERRAARAKQLLGQDRTYERLIERDLVQLRTELRPPVRGDLPAVTEDVRRTEEEERLHEQFLAEQAAEEAEERRKAIAKANRSRFTKEEHKRRYGKDVQYRSGQQSMKDMTSEADKRSFLEAVHRDFTARGGVVGASPLGKGYAAGAVSMHAFAIERNINTETLRQHLFTWEALVDIHDRTGRWPQVRRARYAILRGWRAGDDFPFPDKVMQPKLPNDLEDMPASRPHDFNKVDLAGKEPKSATEPDPDAEAKLEALRARAAHMRAAKAEKAKERAEAKKELEKQHRIDEINERMTPKGRKSKTAPATSEAIHKRMIYSESYRRRHGG